MLLSMEILGKYLVIIRVIPIQNFMSGKGLDLLMINFHDTSSQESENDSKILHLLLTGLNGILFPVHFMKKYDETLPMNMKMIRPD